MIVSGSYHIQAESVQINAAAYGADTLLSMLSGTLQLCFALSDAQVIALHDALVDRRSRIAQKQLHEAEAGKWCTCTDPVHAGGDVGCAVHGKVPA